MTIYIRERFMLLTHVFSVLLSPILDFDKKGTSLQAVMPVTS